MALKGKILYLQNQLETIEESYAVSQSTTKLKVRESTEYKNKVKSNDILAIHLSQNGYSKKQ